MEVATASTGAVLPTPAGLQGLYLPFFPGEEKSFLKELLDQFCKVTVCFALFNNKKNLVENSFPEDCGCGKKVLCV